MADEADITDERMALELPRLIAASRKPVGPAACGACHFCGEPVTGTRVFCDEDCAQDWQREQMHKAREGRR